MKEISRDFLEAKAMLETFLAEGKNMESIELAGKMMVESIRKGGKLILLQLHITICK